MTAKRIKLVATVIVVLMCAGSCGEPEPAPTRLPPTSIAFEAAPTATPLPPTVTPDLPSVTPTSTETPTSTATLPPPTDTPLPPSVTPAPAPPAVLSLAAADLEGSILFSVYPEGDIAIMNADGSDQVLLLDRAVQGDVFTDRLATWRPDGKRISYVVDDFEEAEIWVMDSDGSNAQLLVADVAPVTSHSWSPDGTQIAFVRSGQDICILDLASQTVTNLTGERLGGERLSDARDPDWSPDGLRIAFSASDGRNQDIYLINADGTGITKLTSHEARDKHPDWSPDGMAIVFSSTRRSQRYPDLFSLDLTLGTEEEGNMPLQLTAEDKLKERPDWSPDGSWIMFLSNELGAGHGTIYAVSEDGRFLVQVTPDGVYHSPRWRP